MVKNSVISEFALDVLRSKKRFVELFTAAGYQDDRLLFVNRYNMLVNLATEEPKTETGKLAIRSYATEIAGKINSLYLSLCERGMLK